MSEIQKFYEDDCNESKRLSSQAGQIEYITTMDYLKKYCKSGMEILDACAGGGIYSFPPADLGCKVTAAAFVVFNILEPDLKRVGFETVSGCLTVTKKDDLYEMSFPQRMPKRIDPMPEMVKIFGFEPLELYSERDLYVLLEKEQEVDGKAIAA